MDAYPFNLILAVATASATIFLGFLPTKSISSAFFARETAKALLAWVLVAFTSSPKIMHLEFVLAFLCFASWWHFRRDRALNGKMWLSMASGLGISLGIMFILTVTPRAYPPGLPPLNETLLLASIYLGSAVIGLAYTCCTLSLSEKAGVTQNILRRYTGLLLGLTIARAAVLLVTYIAPPRFYTYYPQIKRYDDGLSLPPSHTESFFTPSLPLLMLFSAVFILPFLAFFAQRATGFSSLAQPTRYLAAIIVIAFLTEILVRTLVL